MEKARRDTAQGKSKNASFNRGCFIDWPINLSAVRCLHISLWLTSVKGYVTNGRQIIAHSSWYWFGNNCNHFINVRLAWPEVIKCIKCMKRTLWVYDNKTDAISFFVVFSAISRVKLREKKNRKTAWNLAKLIANWQWRIGCAD